MKVYVMSAERRSGVGKKTGNPYDSVVCQCVYTIGNKFAVKELWISPDQLEGAIPQYGDILDVSVDFGGFVQAVKFIENVKFALNERSINKQ